MSESDNENNYDNNNTKVNLNLSKTSSIDQQDQLDLAAEDIDLDLDIAHRMIARAEKLGAQDAEVYMVIAVGTDFSIEKDEVKFASSGTEFGTGIRLIKDSRLGFGYCTNLDNSQTAIQSALRTTKLRKETKFSFVKDSPDQNISSIFDRSIFDISVEDGLSKARTLIEAGKQMDQRIMVTGGGVGYGAGSIALVTSNGVELKYRSSGIYGGITTFLKNKSVSTGFEFDHSRKDDMDYEKIGKIAAELAINGQDPKPVESGNYKVIFTPQAISELLEFTILPALYGEQALKGETFYSGKMNQQVTKSDISFVDNGVLDNGLNTAPWDDEGTRTQKTVLVENGELKR
jgi:PmbA protein